MIDKKIFSDRIEYYKDGKLHRENGPALEYADGVKIWYKEGELHREDGPALEWSNGDKHWYQNGFSHREDGPAVEYINGNKEFWHKGKYFPQIKTTKEFIKLFKLKAFW